MRRRLNVLAVAWLLLWVGSCGDGGFSLGDDLGNEPSADGAYVRVVHAAADAPPIALWSSADENKALVGNVAYGAVSTYQTVPTSLLDQTTFELRRTDSSQVILPSDKGYPLVKGQRYTLVIAGLAAITADNQKLRLLVLEEGFDEPAAGRAQLRFVHGAAGLGTLSLPVPDSGGKQQEVARFADSGAAGLAYPAGQRFSLKFPLTTTTDTRFTVELPEKNKLFAIATGLGELHPRSTESGTAGLGILLVGPEDSDLAGGRWIQQDPVLYPMHAVPDLGPVDIFVDADGDGAAEFEAFDNVGFGNLSDQTPIQLFPGNVAVDVFAHQPGAARPSTAPLLSSAVELKAGQRYALTVSGFLSKPSTTNPGLALALLADGLALDDAANARVQLVHAGADLLGIDLGISNGTALSEAWFAARNYLSSSEPAGRMTPPTGSVSLGVREGSLPLVAFQTTDFAAGQRSLLLIAGAGNNAPTNALSLIKITAPINDLGVGVNEGLWTSQRLLRQ